MKMFVAFWFVVFVFFFGLIPFWVLYRIADFIYFLLFKIFGYRKKVIISNLKKVFPLKSEKEIQQILSAVYLNLSDVLIEGIKGFTMLRKQVVKRHKITNPEILESIYQSGVSIIGVTGHYCNWEWGSLSASLQTQYEPVAFYKPLSNKWIDRFMHWSRSKYGTKLTSIYETADTFNNRQNIKSIYLMAADQNPAKKKKSIWVDFLGIDTAFLDGPERYAKKYNYPVVYMDVQRKKRGFYTIELSIITLNPSELPDGEITKRYAAKLESVILNEPGNWLWSHKRWKMKR
ncbi:MAG: lysophospholipid acyltransferase family protein [Bacteroidales bacterium]